MSHRRSRSGTPPSYSTHSNDPWDLKRRIFVGNLPTSHMDKKDMVELFRLYGRIQAVSLLRGYGFVQFERPEDASAAAAGHNGRLYRGYKLDINMASDRQRKPRSSPPRRSPGYEDSRAQRPRSRSPVHGRDSREHRDSRDIRVRSREPRPAAPRVPIDARFRGSDGRDKDPRDASYRNDHHGRGYRDEFEAYRKKEKPFSDRFKEPWTGRREPEVEQIPPEEQRRNELYHRYFEELQRRYDAERPVDCSIIVINKLQKEYAENVGRKVRSLGMIVDLIFLNTEVSLTQALEDVSRAHTPFAIVITQQHEVHRSCTVNILFGTPQEHRNMPFEDAMLLVAQNYNSFKVENISKERAEISRKAAKMADDVLIRDLDRDNHPVTLLTAVTLLYEGRLLTNQELTGLINYLQDKRDRMVRGSTDPHPGTRSSSVPTALVPVQPAQALNSTNSINTSHLQSGSTPSSQQQEELQAKILSLFNSGTGSSVNSGLLSAPQSQGYGATPTSNLSGSSLSNSITPSHESQSLMNSQLVGQAAGNHMPIPQGPQRAPVNNFDPTSVQKAIDTLMQSGPVINQLVNATGQQVHQGMNQGRGQGMNQRMASGMNHGMGQGVGQGINQGRGQGMGQGGSQVMNHGMGQGFSQGMGQGMGYSYSQGMGQTSQYPHHY